MKIRYVFLSLLIAIMLCGCGKTYADYPNMWKSADGMVMVDPKMGTVTIAYDEIDETRNINALSDSGQSYLYFCYGEIGEADTSECIWEVEARIKDDKLILTIVKDNVTKMEGQEIVLEQIEN